jgi:hypothetical protein
MKKNYYVIIVAVSTMLVAYQYTMAQTNTRLGIESLQNNTSGTDNTAIGFRAMRFNSSGIDNTGIGRR